jgi:PAS domain S-box-containing protein
MTNGDLPSRPSPWYRRLHAALMPDYNPAATTYWWLATGSGALLLLWCLSQLVGLPWLALLQIAIGLVFALSAGLFPVRVPGTRLSLGVGELTIFFVLLLHGVAAATVLAAAEASVGSYRTSKRWTSRFGSPAMATLAMFAAASLFQTGRSVLMPGMPVSTVPLLAWALCIGLVYFVLSATLMGGVARLRRGEHLLRLSDLLGAFRWVGLAYAASAVFATLLYIVYLQADAGVFIAIVPLLAMLLLVLHFFYRQQEAQEAMQAALAEVARREQAMQTREVETLARHQHELQLSERRFLGAFTHAAIGMVLLDLAGHILESNEALSRLLGRPAQALLGLDFADLLHTDDRELFLSRLAMACDIHFEDFEQQLRLLGADGRLLPVRANCSFFSGPAARGAAQAGKPCLILQVQVLDGATGRQA